MIFNKFKVFLKGEEIQIFNKRKQCIYTNNRGFERNFIHIGKRYIMSKDSDNDKMIWKFNRNKDLLYFKSSHDNTEYWFKYNKDGKPISFRSRIDGEITEATITYENDLERVEYFKPKHFLTIYDKNKNLIFYKTKNLEETWKYNKFGRIEKYSNSHGDSYNATYDETGKLISLSGQGSYKSYIIRKEDENDE